MLHNHARLVHFIHVANGITGRKKLQKMIYVLQKCHVPFKEKFQFHFYGPYSEELTLRIEELCNLQLIEEEREDKGNYYRYNYKITTDGAQFLEQFSLDMPKIERKVELLQKQSSRFLELVATMFFFESLPKAEIENKVRTVKEKQKYTADEFTEAWEFIRLLEQTVH